MKPVAEGNIRLTWLDGLRGVAAVQVVLLHYATALLPGLGMLNPARMHYSWEQVVAGTPLFFFLNGHVAVYIFFVLSGAALTYSFAPRPFAWVRSAVRRAVRLGVPMIAAILFASLLLLWLPDAHVAAGKATGSQEWLGSLSPGTLRVNLVLHQIFFEGMVTGYSNTSLLPHFVICRLGLGPTSSSIDAPLWTLHVEFIGSLATIMLVMIRASAPTWLHRTICIALGLMFLTSPLVLFVVGHLAAPLLQRRPTGRGSATVGLALLLTGITISSGQANDGLDRLLAHSFQPPFGTASDPFHLRYTVAALFLFFGVVLRPSVQALLCRRAAAWLGKISFSLYLVHFPILSTVVSALFLLALPRFGYAISVAGCTCAGIGLSVLVAALFQRWVDQPAVRLSRALSAWCGKGAAPRPSSSLWRRELTTQNQSQNDRRNIVKAMAHALRHRRQATSNIFLPGTVRSGNPSGMKGRDLKTLAVRQKIEQ